MPNDALLIIDMQPGMLQGDNPPKNVGDIVQRVNSVARVVREAGGIVVFVQHCGKPGDNFAQGEPGWPILPSLEKLESDHVVFKTTCDSFYESDLDTLLRGPAADQQPVNLVPTVTIAPREVVVEPKTVTVWITNSNGSQTSVRLRKSGPGYIGPQGEWYHRMPGNEQLRVVYGF